MDGGTGTLLIILFIAFGIFAWACHRDDLNLTKALKEAAEKFNGSVDSGIVLFQHPSLIFRHEDDTITVRTVLWNQYSYETILEAKSFKLMDSSFCVFITGFLGKIGTGSGMESVKIGNKIFDETFRIKSNNEETLRAFLTTDIQRELFKIRSRDPFLLMRSNTLSLEVPGKMLAFEDLDPLIELFLASLERIKEM